MLADVFVCFSAVASCRVIAREMKIDADTGRNSAQPGSVSPRLMEKETVSCRQRMCVRQAFKRPIFEILSIEAITKRVGQGNGEYIARQDRGRQRKKRARQEQGKSKATVLN